MQKLAVWSKPIKAPKAHTTVPRTKRNLALLALSCVLLLAAYIGAIVDNVSIIFGLGALAVLGLCLLDDLPTHALAKIYRVLAFFGAPVATMAVVHILCGKSLTKPYGLGAMAITYLMFLALQGLLVALFGRLHTATGLSLVVLAGFAAVNWCVFGFRGSMIVPTDIYALGTALDVAGSYRFVVDSFLAIGVVLAVAVLVLLRKNKQPQANKATSRLVLGVLTAGFFVVLFALTCTKQVFAKMGMSVDYWNQMENEVSDYGLYFTLVLDIGDLYSNEPDNYAPERLTETLAPSDSASASLAQNAAEQPTILFIMNESLADFALFGDTQLSEDYLPYLHSLAGSDNDTCYVGTLSVPVFGGGTCTTEFETLTGFSGSYGYSTTGAYTTLVKRDVSSGVRYYNALGYETVAFHPEKATNWNRNTAWPALGFERSLFAEDLPFEGIGFVNGEATQSDRCSDAELYQAVLQQMQGSETPQFVFALTMQNHGGYGHRNIGSIAVQDSSNGYVATNEYLWLARQSDEAFRDLIAELETWDKPVMVVLYGDHLPAVDEEYLSLLAQNPTEMAAQSPQWARYTTPLVVWNNFGADLSVFPEHTSTSYLQTLVRQAAGLPLTAQDKVTASLMQAYPILLPDGAIAADGREVTKTELAQNADAQTLKQLMYNAYIDKKGTVQELFLPAT